MERRDPAICNASNIGDGKDEMTKASIDLQDLRRRIYIKAKAEPSWRFWGLYVHVCKVETLRAAYEMAKQNDGAPGVDGVTFEAIEAQGAETLLEQLRDELTGRTYKPLPARRQEIPKDGGKVHGRAPLYFLGPDCTFSASALWLEVLKAGTSSGSRPLSGSTRTTGEFASASPPAVRSSGAARSRHCARVFSQKICATTLPPFAAANSEPETMALASAIPPSRSSRHRLRSVFGEHLTILAISSWRTPSPARWRTFSRTAALTTNGFLAIEGA